MNSNEFYLKGFKKGWEMATKNFEKYMKLTIDRYPKYCESDEDSVKVENRNILRCSRDVPTVEKVKE